MSKYTGVTEAKARAIAKYDEKTYKKMLFRLRVEEDAEIIKAIQEAQEQGINKREWLHELFYNGNK